MSQASTLSEAKRQLLARYLCGQSGASPSAGIAPRPADAPMELAPAQERMWRHAKAHPELTCYNEPITFYRHAPLDLNILERSFTELVRRHEPWRTTFLEAAGVPLQVVHPPASVKLAFTDLRNLPPEDRENTALCSASRHASMPFNLERGPLFRALVTQLAEDDYRIFVTAHHLTLDGVTVFDILYSELTSIYDAAASGTPAHLPDLPVQYADFAYWQRQQLTPDVIAREVAYWRAQLAGNKPALLPTDRPRPSQPTYRGAIHSFAFPKGLSDDLRAFSQQHGVTLFVTLLTAYAVLVHRYTGQKDISVGTVAPGGRKRSEIQHLMGLMQHRLPLRIVMSGDPSLRELLLRARYVISEALCHDEVPFEMIGDHLLSQPVETLYPFFQTMFSLEPPVAEAGPGWGFTTMDFDPGGARLNLYIEIDDRPTGMLGRAQYNCDLFTPNTIARLARDLEATLAAFVGNPELRISEMPPLQLINAAG